MSMERDALSRHPVQNLCVLLAALVSICSADIGAAVAVAQTAVPAEQQQDDDVAQAQQKTATEETVAGSDANIIDGMIDGDVPAAVSGSIIPKVLSASEREKLGMTQGRFALPTLSAASTALSDGKADGDRHPETFVQQFGEFTEPLPESGMDRGEDWHWSWCYWSAANTFSNPRYFEDRLLERHGQECVACLQPLASGARFFGTVPMLPYLWTISNPCDCEYSLGHYPAGQCVPIMMQRPPYENRAAVVEAGAAAALIIGFP